jgi:hypothetical protein
LRRRRENCCGWAVKPDSLVSIKKAKPRVRVSLADWNHHAMFRIPPFLLLPHNKALRYGGPVCVSDCSVTRAASVRNLLLDFF